MQRPNGFSLLSRRHFLLGSAALAGTASRSALDANKPAIDGAAPRGKRRNLLSNACSPERLRQSLIPRDKSGHSPPFKTAAPGTGCARRRGRACLQVEKNICATNGPMPATIFLEYARNGNRTDYENIRNARIAALQSLIFAECVEIKAAFLTTLPTECGPYVRRVSGAYLLTSTFRRQSWDCRIQAIPSRRRL